MIMKSNFLSLDLKDLIKGFIMAIIGALVAAAYQAIQNNALEWTWVFWQPIVYLSIGAGLSYLLKNLFTNSDDKFAKVDKT